MDGYGGFALGVVVALVLALGLAALLGRLGTPEPEELEVEMAIRDALVGGTGVIQRLTRDGEIPTVVRVDPKKILVLDVRASDGFEPGDLVRVDDTYTDRETVGRILG